MYRKIFFLMVVLAFAVLNAQNIHTQWTFDVQNLSPSTGTGTLSTKGPVTYSFVAGTPTDAMQTTNYPPATGEDMAGGIQMVVSTAGIANLTLTWNQAHTNTSANRTRVMYTIDGTNFMPFDSNPTNSTNILVSNGADHGFEDGRFVTSSGGGTTWYIRTVNFTGVPGVDDNPLFAAQIVATKPSGSDSYQAVSGNYNPTGGNQRFDNITFSYIDENQVVTPVATPAGGLHQNPVSVQLTTATPDATIYFTTNGTDPTEASTPYTAPISISEMTTLKFRAYKGEMTPSIIVTEAYLFPATVTNIAQLRAQTPGTGVVYTLDFEVIVTHTQPSFRNQRYVQDDTGGIVVDNPASSWPVWNVGEGYTGLSGTIAVFNGLLQFSPTANPGEPTSTGNPVTPVDIDIAEMIDNFDAHESRLVRLTNVWFTAPGVNFGNNQQHQITDGNRFAHFRSIFGDADYVVTPTAVPAGNLDMVGILIENANGRYITPRSLADMFGDPNQVASPTASVPSGLFTQPFYVELSCATSGATIYYTLDGSNPTDSSTPYTTSIFITEPTTLKMRAYKSEMTPSIIVTVNYAGATPINSMAELRSMTPGTGIIYRMNFDVVVTHTQPTFRNQRYVQDSTGGITIDDLNGIITTTWQVGDAIRGLTGSIELFGGLLQFIPTVNPAAPISQGNIVVPLTITLEQYLNDFDTYESRLVRFSNVTFVNPTGNFATAQVYPITDGTNTAYFRATFADANYIGTAIPTEPQYIAGILLERDPTTGNNGRFITARNLADISTEASEEDILLTPKNALKGNYPNPFNPSTTISFSVSPQSISSVILSEAKNLSPHNYTSHDSPHIYGGGRGGTTPVKIEIFNIRGQRIRTLVNDTYTTGTYNVVWNGTDDAGRSVGSGIYFYKMTTPEYSATKRMLLMK